MVINILSDCFLTHIRARYWLNSHQGIEKRSEIQRTAHKATRLSTVVTVRVLYIHIYCIYYMKSPCHVASG